MEEETEKKHVATSSFHLRVWRVDAYQSQEDGDFFIDHTGKKIFLDKGDFVVLLDSGKKIIKINEYVFKNLF